MLRGEACALAVAAAMLIANFIRYVQHASLGHRQLLTVLLRDAENRLLRTDTPTNTWSVGKPIFDIEYADDTPLFGITTPQLESMLDALEHEARLYGLTLNMPKSERLIQKRKTSQQGLFEKPQWIVFQGEETPVHLDRLSLREAMQLERGKRFCYVDAPVYDDFLSEETLVLGGALPSSSLDDVPGQGSAHDVPGGDGVNGVQAAMGLAEIGGQQPEDETRREPRGGEGAIGEQATIELAG